MKIIGLIVILLLAMQTRGQNRTPNIQFVVNILKNSDSRGQIRGYDIRVAIINNDSISYYYGKSFQQKFVQGILNTDFAYDLRNRKEIGLSYSIISQGNNNFDTLIKIMPRDSLIVTYSNLNLEKKANVSVEEYFSEKFTAYSLTEKGTKYFNKYSCQVFRANIVVKKKNNKFTNKVQVVNFCDIYKGLKRDNNK